MIYDICTIGHITLDKVVTDKLVAHMPGGTAFYFSKALRHLDVDYTLVTALASTEKHILTSLRAESIKVCALPSEHTVHFENVYSANQDHREQFVHHKAASFTLDELPAIEATVFHLGPLLSDDIPLEVLKDLASRGIVSLDIQGYLRYVKNKKVLYRDWADKQEGLPYVTVLKANEFEMEVITGQTDVQEGARYLADMGVQEVIITLGSQGSVIYTDGTFHQIPAFQPTAVVDATGCGDTYMAGYLYKKTKGAPIQEAGEFGAAMATLNIESSGPVSGTTERIKSVISRDMVTKTLY